MFNSLRKRRSHISGALFTALLSLWLSIALLPCAMAEGMAQSCPKPMPCCPPPHDHVPKCSGCAVMQAATIQDHEGPVVASQGVKVMSALAVGFHLTIPVPPAARPALPRGPDPALQDRVLLI